MSQAVSRALGLKSGRRNPSACTGTLGSPITFQGLLPSQHGLPSPLNQGRCLGCSPLNPSQFLRHQTLKSGYYFHSKKYWKCSRRSPRLPKGLFPFSSLSELYAWCMILEKVGFLKQRGRKYSANKVLYPFSNRYFKIIISLHNVFFFANVEYLRLW